MAVLRRGPIARADLARRLQLSTPSLTRIVRQLMDAGIVVELAPTQIARTGRPSLPIAVAPDRAWFVGIKIVNDAAHAVACDLSGEVRDTASRPLVDTDVEVVVGVIADLVVELTGRHPQIVGVGIALAAVVQHGCSVRSARFLGWSEEDLGGRVQTATGLPCVLANDVQAFTLAEHWFGIGRGLSSFVVITVGAGVGAGVVVHDRLVDGPYGRAGMVGHVIVDPDGRPCYEDHRGCAYQTLSDQGLSAQFGAALGREVGFGEGLELASTEPAIERVLQHASRCLGRLTGTIANLVDPARVLLSGESISWVRRDAYDEGLAETTYDHVTQTDVVVQQIEVSEWARGAAAGAVVRYVLD